MPFSHLILCRPLLLLTPIPSSIRALSNESPLCMRWPKYWSFSFSIIPSKEHPGLIAFICHPLLFLPSIFPSIRVFSNQSPLCMRWPKYWSFSFSIIPSKEHPGLISFRMGWLNLLAVQGTLQESSPTPQFKSVNSSVLSFLHSPTLASIHNHWKNHSLD